VAGHKSGDRFVYLFYFIYFIFKMSSNNLILKADSLRRRVDAMIDNEPEHETPSHSDWEKEFAVLLVSIHFVDRLITD
jgi:hypothetical protein